MGIAIEIRNFKFSVRIDLGKYHLTHDKILPKAAWSGSMVEFLNFKTPYLDLERVKLYRNFKFGTRIDLGKLASPISSVTKYPG